MTRPDQHEQHAQQPAEQPGPVVHPGGQAPLTDDHRDGAMTLQPCTDWSHVLTGYGRWVVYERPPGHPVLIVATDDVKVLTTPWGDPFVRGEAIVRHRQAIQAGQTRPGPIFNRYADRASQAAVAGPTQWGDLADLAAWCSLHHRRPPRAWCSGLGDD